MLSSPIEANKYTHAPVILHPNFVIKFSRFAEHTKDDDFKSLLDRYTLDFILFLDPDLQNVQHSLQHRPVPTDRVLNRYREKASPRALISRVLSKFASDYGKYPFGSKALYKDQLSETIIPGIERATHQGKSLQSFAFIELECNCPPFSNGDQRKWASTLNFDLTALPMCQRLMQNYIQVYQSKYPTRDERASFFPMWADELNADNWKDSEFGFKDSGLTDPQKWEILNYIIELYPLIHVHRTVV
jgi:hypothetical protein